MERSAGNSYFITMKLKSIIILSLVLPLTGCVGTGPNTQRDAVAGGALGALAGGIIGANSRGHNALAGALIGGTVGAIAGGTIGNAQDHQDHTIYQESAPVEVQSAPPPPQYRPRTEIIIPAPGPGYVWMRGYWYFDGRNYIWIEGRWVLPPVGYSIWIEPRWESRGGRYFFRRGYWRR